jgi:glycosyltransferase involved in cell wall biosynthesis
MASGTAFPRPHALRSRQTGATQLCNDSEAIAAAIAQLLESPELRRQLSAAAGKRLMRRRREL